MHDYYDLDDRNPPSIEDITNRWARESDKPASWDHLILDYPLEEIWQYREYDRDPDQDSNLEPEEWDSLRRSMETRGWDPDAPAVLLIGKNGVAKVGEGNHRLWVARELGFRTVPVRFGGFWQTVEPGVGQGGPQPTAQPEEPAELEPQPAPHRTRKPVSPEDEAQVDRLMQLFSADYREPPILYRGHQYRLAISEPTDQELLDSVTVNAHFHHDIAGNQDNKALYLEWFMLASALRGQGLGTRAYDLWEASLPATVKLVYAHAADSGQGNTMDFWDQVGFSPVYCEETNDYEADNYIVKPVGAWPTPKCVEVEADEEDDDY